MTIGITSCQLERNSVSVVVEMKNNYGYLSAVDYPFWQVYYVKGRQTCDKQMMTDTATDKQTSVWLHGEAVRQTNQ
jgi:hypothetical protein